ncbi:MAG: M23 family metallopeptidase [bacterium]|nr:M23 family metallopeptidase [bacterium]
MRRTRLFVTIIIMLYSISCDPAQQEEEFIYEKPMIPSAGLLARCPVSDGFDFPVGPPNAKGYYNAQRFGKNTHLGEDWNGVGGGNTDLGDPVYAPANGIVLFARDIKIGWGNVVRIIHNVGSKKKPRYVESLYGHMENLRIKKNSIVRRGQQLGTIGNLDGYYAAHLHFEIRETPGLPIMLGYSTQNKGFVSPTRFIKKHRPRRTRTKKGRK